MQVYQRGRSAVSFVVLVIVVLLAGAPSAWPFPQPKPRPQTAMGTSAHRGQALVGRGTSFIPIEHRLAHAGRWIEAAAAARSISRRPRPPSVHLPTTAQAPRGGPESSAPPAYRATTAATLPAGSITTAVGAGLATGPALDSRQNALAVAVSGSTIYVADDHISVLWALDTTTGLERVVAGTGSPGYSGDGGQGTAAMLRYPSGLNVDGQGNVFFADSGNNVIRKLVPSTGVITTVAGTGVAGYTGDGAQATSAQLNNPLDVLPDAAGTLWIADSNNHVIRKISPAGTITTVYGTSSNTAYPTGLSFPSSLAFLGGSLLIADPTNFAVYQLTGSTLSVFAGTGVEGTSGDGGPATSAQLDYPISVSTTTAGVVYIADMNNNEIRTVSAGHITKYVTDVNYPTNGIQTPQAVTPLPSGALLTASNGALVTTSNGVTKLLAGGSTYSGDGGAAITAQAKAQSVTTDANGLLYLTDYSRSKNAVGVRAVGATGQVSTVALFDSTSCPSIGTPNSQNAIAVAPDGSIWLNNGGGLCHSTGSTTSISISGCGPGTSYTNSPGAVVTTNGTIYVGRGNTLCEISPTGVVSTRLLGFTMEGLALDSAGNLWTLTENANSPGSLVLMEITADGLVHTVRALTTASPVYNDIGGSLTISRSGNIFYADGHQAVYEAPASGGSTQIAGRGGSATYGAYPSGYLGRIMSVPGPNGDGGTAASSNIDGGAVTLDTQGNLFEVDNVFWTGVREIIGADGLGAAGSASGPQNLASYPVAGISPVEEPGPSNPAEVCGCGQRQATGNPVDTASGSFWHTFTDLAVPGRGPAVAVTRTYDSLNATSDGLFGYGWNSPYSMTLQTDPLTGGVEVRQENGSVVSFTDNGRGYQPIQPRQLATLTYSAGVYTFTRRSRQSFTFSTAGQLTAITDLNGNKTSLSYDTSGHLNGITDPAGRSFAVTTTNGRITQITAPGGRTATYTYDAAGNLTSAADPTTATWTYTYDSGHQLLSMLDPNQQGTTTPVPVTNVYDTQGRITQQSDQLKRTTLFDYTSITGATKVTDPAGEVTVDYYSNGLRSKATTGYGTAAAATTTYTYDPTTEAPATITDPLNHTTSYTYDGAGNELSRTDPLHQTTTRTYDSLNDLLTSTDPAGVTTTNTYDTRGNRLTASTPLLAATGSVSATRAVTYTYGNATFPGDVTAVTDPDGHTTAYGHDPFGDLTSVTAPATAENPAGNKTTYTYDTNTGWRLSMVSPKGTLTGATPALSTTTYAYDPDGRRTAVRDSLWTSTAPKAHQTSSTYTLDGTLSSSTDGNGNLITYTYDLDNELTATAEPIGVSTHQSWTPDGQLLTSTDGAGNVTSYGYDPRNDRTSSKDPLGRVTGDSYDLAGNLVAQTAPGAVCGATPTSGCTVLTYNVDNQLLTRSYLDGITHAVTGITYDPDGRRTGQTDATGASTWTYDSLGRLTSTTDGAGTTTAATYDLAGNVLTVTYPGTGHTVTRTYDVLNRAASVTDWAGNKTVAGYDADSNLTSQTLPASTGEVDRYTYNQVDQLTQTALTQTTSGTTSTLAGFTYTRDTANQLKTATTTGTGGVVDPTQTYGYNALNELTASGSTTTPTTYGYSSGNTLTNRGTTSGGTASTQAFDAADQLCWKAAATVTTPACTTAPSGATTYTYNPSGDRTAAKVNGTAVATYTYDEAQELTTSTTSAGTPTTYTYDGDGLRLTKTTASVTAHFVWDHSGALPMAITDGTSYFIYGPDGAPLEQIGVSSGTITYLHHDQIGSTRLLTSTTGAVTGTATYDPYGNPTAHTGATTPLGYLGEYTENETGLTYLRHRYYDRASGQFLTLDLAVISTREPYGYAGGNPLSNTDPLGLDFLGISDSGWVTIGLVAGGIALAATGVGLVADAGLFGLELGLPAVQTLAGVATGATVVSTTTDAVPCVRSGGTNVAACIGTVLGVASFGNALPAALMGPSLEEGSRTILDLTSELTGGAGASVDFNAWSHDAFTGQSSQDTVSRSQSSQVGC